MYTQSWLQNVQHALFKRSFKTVPNYIKFITRKYSRRLVIFCVIFHLWSQCSLVGVENGQWHQCNQSDGHNNSGMYWFLITTRNPWYTSIGFNKWPWLMLTHWDKMGPMPPINFIISHESYQFMLQPPNTMFEIALNFGNPFVSYIKTGLSSHGDKVLWLSHCGWVTHICVSEVEHHWLRQQLGTRLLPQPMLTKC